MTTEFRSAVEKAFAGPAATYALRTLTENSDRFGSEVVLGNATTALRLRLEPREGLFVSLLRIHNTVIPSRDLEDRLRDPINGFDLDDLIALRATECSVHSKAPLTEATVQVALRDYASFLIENGKDVLSGDFTVFADLARCVAARIRRFQSEGHASGPDSRRFLEAVDQLGLSD